MRKLRISVAELIVLLEHKDKLIRGEAALAIETRGFSEGIANFIHTERPTFTS